MSCLLHCQLFALSPMFSMVTPRYTLTFPRIVRLYRYSPHFDGCPADSVSSSAVFNLHGQVGSGLQVQLQEVVVPPATLTMPERRGKRAETMVQWGIYNDLRIFGAMKIFCASIGRDGNIFVRLDSSNPKISNWRAAGKSPNFIALFSSRPHLIA